MVKYTLKKTAKFLSYRQRYRALNSNDQVKARNLKRLLLFLMVQKSFEDSSSSEFTNRSFEIAAAQYLNLVMTDVKLTNAPKVTPQLRCHIDEFHDYECKLMFSFRSKSCLHRLKKALNFPEYIIFSNRSRMSGEECFLRGLYELVSGENQEKICINVFGRECTTQSRAFNYFINYIYNNFRHVLTDNLEWFYRNKFFEESAAAIGNKISLTDVTNLVFAFISCWRRPFR